MARSYRRSAHVVARTPYNLVVAADRPVTLAALKRYAVARSLFAPVTLAGAIERLGFVQADPIRAPARAQDLVLRHRVRGYRAGDLERRYPALLVEEDFFINYGFVSRTVHARLHPRAASAARSTTDRRRGEALLDFVRARGTVHPRDVDRHFAHGSVTNYWGGSSSATTHLLDDLHYRGRLRVARRENGVRVYALRESAAGSNTADASHVETRGARDAALDALIDVAVSLYAPVPSATLAWLVNRLRYGTPQWRAHLKAALARAKSRLSHARLDGVDWYWPADEADAPATAGRSAARFAAGRRPVRLLAPFDPVVWDRRRFEHFWGWAYRFEAYTPAAKRKLGYYALPLLWGDEAIGWANLSVQGDALVYDTGYATRAPADPAFAAALQAELERLRVFLGASHVTPRRAR